MTVASRDGGVALRHRRQVDPAAWSRTRCVYQPIGHAASHAIGPRSGEIGVQSKSSQAIHRSCPSSVWKSIKPTAPPPAEASLRYPLI